MCGVIYLYIQAMMMNDGLFWVGMAWHGVALHVERALGRGIVCINYMDMAGL
jgi:hypothetical protein